MRALSLQQPYATLVAIGAKRWETRSWRTRYRGPLAIQASLGNRPLPGAPQALAALQAAGFPDLGALPHGVVVAVCELVDCVRVEQVTGFSALEREVGDFSAGRFAWRLEAVRPRALALPVRGHLGLWTWVETPATPAA
jgi:hypothetical protein